MKSPIKRDANSVATMPVGKIFTLVFLKRNSSVLLGLKTRGLGEGLWNGFGGKVEENETVGELC
jgi:8-oxo-dGTP diphosphatase/2-hydroxy-dATP diphosphatase